MLIWSCLFTLQGFLFSAEASDPERRGAVKWPLVGLFDPHGFAFPWNDKQEGVGYNSLRWADQHIHKVGLRMLRVHVSCRVLCRRFPVVAGHGRVELW